jgi:tRNA U54 and U55 pseudouridine synthase Pus10
MITIAHKLKNKLADGCRQACCHHSWKEIKASGMMGIFTPITWHEVTFECTKCHKQMYWKKDFSDEVYDKIKQGEFSTIELKKIFHKPIVFNIPIFKIKFVKEIRPVTIIE